MTDLPEPGATTSAVPPPYRPPLEGTSAQLAAALQEMHRVIVGQERMLERLVCCLLAGGHVLLEGVPGVGKTRTISTLAATLGGSFSRIQFTADLLPSDIVGTRVFRAGREDFLFEPGPVFANFVLADEINRAPAKVQSALLEVMEERQVTVAGDTHPLPAPFLVLATQNPIESEGVFPLPEAQRDRFMMRVVVPLPTPDEERLIVERFRHGAPSASRVFDIDALAAAQRHVLSLDVPDDVTDYMVALVSATRDPLAFGLSELDGFIDAGASPRATMALDRAARALALLRGAPHVSAQEVYDVAYDVLNHRLVLSFDAVARGVRPHDVCAHILENVPAPPPALPAAAPER